MSAQPISPYTRVRQPGTYAAPALSFNLDSELRLLESEKPWQASRTAKTLVKHPDFRVVLVALHAGARVHRHETAGRVSIQVLSGDLCVRLPEQTIESPAGSLLALDRGVPHEVIAHSDAAFLLTIAWPDFSDRAVQVHPLRNRNSRAAAPLVFAVAGKLQTPVTVVAKAEHEPARERGLDKTLADTFPCSDPFSSVPDPALEIA